MGSSFFACIELFRHMFAHSAVCRGHSVLRAPARVCGWREQRDASGTQWRSLCSGAALTAGERRRLHMCAWQRWQQFGLQFLWSLIHDLLRNLWLMPNPFQTRLLACCLVWLACWTYPRPVLPVCCLEWLACPDQFCLYVVFGLYVLITTYLKKCTALSWCGGHSSSEEKRGWIQVGSCSHVFTAENLNVYWKVPF